MSASKRIKTNGMFPSMTNECFKAAAKELCVDGEQMYNTLHEKRQELNALYLKKVLQLPTVDLDLIIYEHESGTIPRAEETIEAVLGELFERMLLKGDSCDPDLQINPRSVS